ncbi:MAG: hypothetical protein U0R49_05725 [Fimbriimonadales bacterium]
MPSLFPHQVTVETDRPIFPDACACSCERAERRYRPTPPDRAKGMPVVEPLEIPLSNACHARLQVSHRIGTLRLVALNCAVWGVAIPMIAKLGWPLMIPGVIVALLLLGNAHSIAQANRCPVSGCNRMGNAMKAIWWKGREYIFSFSNEKYAEMFAQANAENERGPVGKSGPEGWQVPPAKNGPG